MNPKTVFVRDATGLVRELGGFDSMVLAIGAIIGPVWVPIFATLWFTMPGINLPLSLLIIGFLCTIHGMYYVYITGAMPRAGGGGYVALSRVVHPALGIASSMILAFCFCTSLAINLNITVSTGIGAALSTYGSISGNGAVKAIGDALAANGGQNIYAFIGAESFLVIIGLIAISGTRRVILINKIAIIVGTLGMIAIAAILLSVTQSDFVRLFNSYAGEGMYTKVIQEAHTSGWSMPQNTWTPTILGLPLLYFVFMGYSFPTYVGGEMKRPSKTMLITILGSIAYTGFWYIFLSAISLQVMGSDFITSIGYLFFSNSSSYPLTVAPWLNTFFVIINSNPVLNALIILSWIAFGYLLNIQFILIASRTVFAWSFDRAAPAKLAEVSDRWHTPVFLISLILGIAIVISIIYTFTNLLSVANLTFFYTIALLPEGLAGILLPWRKKSLFDASTSMVKRKVAGIPVMTILGAYAVLFSAALVILSLMNPIIIGNINPLGGGGGLFNWSAVIVIGLLGVIMLYAMRAYYKSKGIPVELIYREIPPE